MSKRSVAHILALGIAAASVAGVIAYVMHPPGVGLAQANVEAEPQISNRAAKTDRPPWLPDYSLHSSFSHFSSSLSLALALAKTTSVGHAIVQGNSNGLLNDAQIAGIENRLRLTRQQSEHWPAVAAALRNIAAQHFQRRSTRKNTAPKIHINSPEVQQLIEAAVPLLQLLREDQKREIRQLVHMIGLGSVSLI